MEAENGNYQKLVREQTSTEEELVGDLSALKLLDLATLEREGLGRYKEFLNRKGIQIGSRYSPVGQQTSAFVQSGDRYSPPKHYGSQYDIYKY